MKDDEIQTVLKSTCTSLPYGKSRDATFQEYLQGLSSVDADAIMAEASVEVPYEEHEYDLASLEDLGPEIQAAAYVLLCFACMRVDLC